jgi:hypothetical protein
MKLTLAPMPAGALALALATLPLASLAASADDPAPATATEKKLEKKVDALTRELNELKAQIKAMQANLPAAAPIAAAPSAAVVTQQQAEIGKLQQQLSVQAQQQAQIQAQVQSTAEAVQTVSAKSSPLANINLWGYGELYGTSPTHNSDLRQADLARAVFGIGYQFNDSTSFNSEFEVEHAVSSASDVGEFEVEQFYIDHEWNNHTGSDVGLFLIPTGLLNENHEPTNFYGVQRNFVETLIIPSTWREAGINLHGTTDNGFKYSVGVTTSQDFSKWNFTPEFVPYRSALELEDNDVAPLQATHQEDALANAKHAAVYLSGDYEGIAGLRIGGSAFYGGVNRVLPNTPDDNHVLLWEGHVRYQPGRFDLSALYAHGTLTDFGPANIQFPGTANPIPDGFYGWYLQAAYNLWQQGDYRLAPFVRYERYNMGTGYQGLAPGFSSRPVGALPSDDSGFTFSNYPYANDIVSTVGANFYLTPSIVFKADYQNFRVNRDFTRVDVGMGLAF